MSKKGSTTKRLLTYLGSGVLLIAVFAVIANAMGWMERGEQVRTVETEKAELRTITQTVSASGKMQPEAEVIIRPDVSGEVIELNVREGDFVRAGDLLLRIKPDIYQAQIDDLNAVLLTQRARLEQARANMLQSEIEYKKQAQLYERDLISELDYEQAKNNYEAQKANYRAAEFQIESAKAQLRRAEEELEQTVIRAPKDGTISRLSIERGDRVLGNAQTAGTEMMRIARMDQMEVIVDVNENDIVNVSLQDTATIEVDAYPDRIFEGIVTEIANSADVTGSGSAEQVTNYKVKISVVSPHNYGLSSGDMVREETDENPDMELIPNFKPGMSGTVDILANTVYNVVSVPIQAVTVREIETNVSESDSLDAEIETTRNNRRDNYQRVVFVVYEGKAVKNVVKTGISDDRYIQIQSGIQENDEVVTGSYRVLSRELADGDLIEISDRNQIAARN